MRKSQKEIAESSRSITRRGLALGAIQMAVVSVLGLKLRSMQIEHADEYRLLSDGNSIKIELLPPARGLILDRNGMIIAGNEQNYRVTLTREEAGDYIKTYFQRFPGIRDYMDATKKQVHAHGYVETIFGRRIHYPEINTKNPSMRGFLERAAINAPIQGSAADVIRRAMIRMPVALEDAKLASARMLLQVHDELVFEAADNETQALIQTARRVMETAAEPALKLSVPIHVDAKAASNWDEAH